MKTEIAPYLIPYSELNAYRHSQLTLSLLNIIIKGRFFVFQLFLFQDSHPMQNSIIFLMVVILKRIQTFHLRYLIMAVQRAEDSMRNLQCIPKDYLVDALLQSIRKLYTEMTQLYQENTSGNCYKKKNTVDDTFSIELPARSFDQFAEHCTFDNGFTLYKVNLIVTSGLKAIVFTGKTVKLSFHFQRIWQ